MSPAERRRFMAAGAYTLAGVFLLAYILLRLSAGLAPQAESYRRIDTQPVAGRLGSFVVYDFSRRVSVKVTMMCVKVSRHAVIYKEPALELPAGLADRIATEFDGDIYSVNKQALAPPALMGLAGETRTTVLLLDEARGRSSEGKQLALAGYYTQQNEMLQAYRSASNQAKIVHVFIGNFAVDQDDVLDTVAHETRHLSHWAVTRNNVGMAISALFALATVITLYLGLSHLYLRSFTA